MSPKKITRQDLRDAADKYKNWGKWGPNDEIGTLNYTSDADIVAAARLVRKGKVISLALNFDNTGPQGAKSNYPAMGRTNPIHTMIRTRRRPIDRHAKTDRLPVLPRPQHKMQIARVKSKNNLSRRRRQSRVLTAHIPVSDETPLVHRRPHRSTVFLRFVLLDRFRRSVVLLPFEPNICFWRRDILLIRRQLCARSVHLH